MGNGYSVPPADDFDRIRQTLQSILGRLSEVETMDGSQINNTVQTLKQLVEGLIEQTDVNVTGSVTAGGNVNSGGTITANALRTATGPTTNITTGRVTSWLQNSDGLVGTATSSERFKANIRRVRDDPDFDPKAVLRLSIDYWEYRAEIAKRDDPASPDYVGANYHVGLNFGPIAERAHDLGLWMIVVYEREDDGITLRRTLDGEPIPYGLHDTLFGYVLAIAVQVIEEERVAEVMRVDALALRLAALDGQDEG